MCRKVILQAIAAAFVMAGATVSCTGGGNAVDKDKNNRQGAVSVGVAPVVRKSLSRQITLSSELVPFQEIDVYAKESGYVQKLLVDYGTRVKAGQLLATLEIPEFQDLLQQDQAEIKNAADQVTKAEHELTSYQAQYKAVHLEFTRLNGVFQSQPGIVAQQEIDNAQGRDVAAESQVDAALSSVAAAESQLNAFKAKLAHDQTLYNYSRITAPFAGVITARYANLGTLVQAGTGSSTQAMPIVRLSEDDLFRLVIPVPESYVRYIRMGDAVDVNVPSLGRTFPGKVARFSVDVRQDTRTMHTEVDVANPDRVLVPGLYADANLTLEQQNNVPTVPIQAISHAEDKSTVWIVNGENKLEMRTVELGLQTATDAEVLSGLNGNEQVVMSDLSGLHAGETVHAQPVQVMNYQEK